MSVIFRGPVSLRPLSVVSNGLIINLDAGNANSYPGSGSTWFDLSGGSNNATLFNSPVYSSDYGGSLKFVTAASNYATDAALSDSYWQGNWTASYWLRFDSISTNTTSTNDRSITQHGTNTTSKGLHLGNRNSRMYFGLFSNDLSGVRTISANTWYNVTFTLNNSTFMKEIYINGVLDTSGVGTAAYTGTGNNTRIGGKVVGVIGIYFPGFINVCQFYNRVLSAEEIAQNFSIVRGRFGI